MNTLSYRLYMIILTVVFYAGTYVGETLSAGELIIVFSLVLMMILYLRRTKMKITIRNMEFVVYVGIFLLFCICSKIWAERPDLATAKINRIIIIFFSIFIIDRSCEDKLSVDDLLKSAMYGSYIVIIYTFFRFRLSGILSLVSNSERLSSEMLNSNTLGMCASYAVVLNIYYILKRSFKLTDLLLIPAVAILLVSQSRKALFIVALGPVGLYVMKNLENKNLGKSLFKLIVSLTGIFTIYYLLSKLPVLQPVLGRFYDVFEMIQGSGTRSGNSAWIRFAYIELGINLFKQHPFFGIGIANANIYTQEYFGHNHYLHNNYVEMLACGGLTGFLIYYSMYIYLLINYIKNRIRADREYELCFIILIINLIVDYGVVSYYDPKRYVLLYIIWKKIQEVKHNGIVNNTSLNWRMNR